MGNKKFSRFPMLESKYNQTALQRNDLKLHISLKVVGFINTIFKLTSTPNRRDVCITSHVNHCVILVEHRQTVQTQIRQNSIEHDI